MCILCVMSRLSRRIVTMLLWLVIPLITLWAFSQLLPPSLRFEITISRLACIFVLLISIGWYEIISPWFSVWRARRSALMKRRKRVEAQMAAKWHKEAIRKCRNCSTAYRDQNPGSGRFMCGYCGHISRRPVLDITRLDPGMTGSMNMENCWRSNVGTFRETFHGGKCPSQGSYSGVAIFILKTLLFPMFFVQWIWKKIWKSSSLSEQKALTSGCKSDIQKNEDRCNFHANKLKKSKRKAEEKRQARLAKEMLEEEERQQREEVARLVEERRKLRNKELEVEKESERKATTEREMEIRKEKEAGRKQLAKEKVRAKAFAKDNLIPDGEKVKNNKGNKNQEKSKLEKSVETRKDILETTAQHASDPMKNSKNYRALRFLKGLKTNGQAMKGVINSTIQVVDSQYSPPMKHSIVSRGCSASYSSAVTWACGQQFGVKSSKTDSYLNTSYNGNGSAGSESLNCGQSTNSVWNRTALSNVWNKGTDIMHGDTCNEKIFFCDSKACGDSKALKHDNSCVDRVNTSESPVGNELQGVSQETTDAKSWQNLCTRPSASSWTSHSSGLGITPKEEKPVAVSSKVCGMQMAPLSSPSIDSSLGSSEPSRLSLAADKPKFSNLVSHSRTSSQLSPAFISPHSCVSPVRPVTVGKNSCEDSLYESDVVSLLGPVSESLGNSFQDTGSSLPLDTKATGVLSSGCTPISAPSHGPVHSASHVSRAASMETDGSVCVNPEQLSPITDLWSLPSLFLDVSNERHEKQNWHIWDMPKVGQCTFGNSPWLLPAQDMSDQERNLIQPSQQSNSQSFAELENLITACMVPSLENENPNQENGDANLWLSQPLNRSTAEGCNELDNQLFPPNFVNCIKKQFNIP